LCKKFRRAKILMRDLASCSCVRGVIPINRFQSRNRFLRIGKGKQSTSSWNIFAKASLLGHDWFSRGEIADTPIAKPPTSGARHDILRDSKFALRGVYILMINVQILRNREWVS